ncbi:Uncharacterised protein [BD1-7 clade bacterium]|uniref:Uncharacterized protein n=1 Tax=BD1-7 clade bacterium TaxID=2029982 RepID=A0A5S9N2F6_9GAMM|nr:Uncharacterised protein [BD1-7 clade bacterium]
MRVLLVSNDPVQCFKACLKEALYLAELQCFLYSFLLVARCLAFMLI